jgi:hypothetical protein
LDHIQSLLIQLIDALFVGSQSLVTHGCHSKEGDLCKLTSNSRCGGYTGEDARFRLCEDFRKTLLCPSQSWVYVGSINQSVTFDIIQYFGKWCLIRFTFNRSMAV